MVAPASVRLPDPPVIFCAGVTKTYGDGALAVAALRGVDLEVHAGELMLLAGPSGCGKTTLVSIIAGLLARDGGRCQIDGLDFDALTAREKTRLRGRSLGFVFQSLHLLASLTAVENVAAPLLIAGVRQSTALAQAAALLGEFGFDRRMQQARPARLSGGQQQRVALARAMVHDPRVIVCDEPTSALDGASGHAVMDLLRRSVLSRRRALLVVTHDPRIFNFGDRIAHMEDGRITRVENLPSPHSPRPL
ncbi:ABC transporter ATP-binding protein [Horticoccus luteus]|uniref:ABC transporter ATP-binding protein n=1 Tax=Horticoccus luteus TaxID=2862869 RepID=A0A8F9TVK7_9BACT|nr:ABC transporter ATP-binding protein [Horticoccus luteus]QYM78786.1 ABC transporter ATP-binding protein [Horticoccus luteus]